MIPFYYWSQGIYAIVGIMFFILAGAIIFSLYKKIKTTNEKINQLVEKVNDMASLTNKVIDNSNKFILLEIYNFLKKLGKKREERSSDEQ